MQINLAPLCVVGTEWGIIRPIVTQQAAILMAVSGQDPPITYSLFVE